MRRLSDVFIGIVIGIVLFAGIAYFDEAKAIAEGIYGQINSSQTTDNQVDTGIKPISEGQETPSNDSVSKPPANPANDQASRPSTPKSNLKMDVSIGEQKLRVYNNDTLIKEWIVSTGKDNSTPLGRFTIQNRGEWFFSEKYQEGAKWWVSFKDWGVYLFHGLPMDRGENIIAEEADKLGKPASHGCVRLEVDNAKWIYDNIPQGTPVYIH